MMRLMKYEFRRIRQHKSLYIVMIINALLLILTALIERNVSAEFAAMLGMSGFSPAEFTLGALLSTSFAYLLGIYLALYVCDDYTNHTLKNIYARGYSRTKVYFTKYLVSLMVSLVWAILCMVLALLLGVIWGDRSITLSGTDFANLGLQLLLVAGYHGVFFGIAQIIGKTGGAVALNLIGMTLLISILSLFFSLCKSDFNPSLWYFDKVLSALSDGGDLTTTIVFKSIFLPIGYSVVFVGGGYLINCRREA